MHIQSHLLIGKIIHKLILDNYGMKLSASHLMFGSIKPDFSLNLCNIPHYKNQSFNIISDMILAMQNKKIPDCQKDLNAFSQELGIILHYISDYFCYAHNNKEMDKMPDHFLYEISLDIQLRKYLSKSMNNVELYFTVEDYNYLENSLIHFIDEKHKQYLNEEPSTINDIYYCTQVGSVVAISIITSAIVKAYPEAA